MRLNLYTLALVQAPALPQYLAQGYVLVRELAQGWYRVERQEPLPDMAVRILEKEAEREQSCK